jgi:ABC-type transport system involved in cytochrome c biogenesis permease subunit
MIYPQAIFANPGGIRSLYRFIDNQHLSQLSPSEHAIDKQRPVNLRNSFSNIVLYLFMFLTLSYPQLGHADDFDMSSFRELPIMHEGRVKPIESFARAHLLAFYGKSTLPDMTASAWLAELLFDPETAYDRKIFNIANPDVLNAIGIEWNAKHNFSFNEVSEALRRNESTIKSLDQMEDNARTPAQQQLLELYYRTVAYAIISESLSLIQPRFKIDNQILSQQLHVPQNQELTFLDLLPHEAQLLALADKIKGKDPNNLSDNEKAIVVLTLDYNRISHHRQAAIFRIIPPQWRYDGDAWTAPWQTLLDGHGSPQTAEYLDLWKKLATSYRQHDISSWNSTATQAKYKAYQIAGAHASAFRQYLEVLYLQIDIFTIALGLYITSFVILMTLFISRKRLCHLAANMLMSIGALAHGLGIAVRITIMNRPPVATLYETTIFVSLIAVILALAFERKRKDGTSLIVGSIIGTVLLFISTRYAADGDTMEMLVAVLNTNFWLATHVVAVTMGYGGSLVAGTLAHLYLINELIQPDNKTEHKNLLNTMLAVGLIAAFFALLGTILGGIWADQSWGRFWGWDPKENGAMLIVLWLLWLLHGRIANVLAPLNFASLLALTNVIVALSWFGVNLLSVGLHSYGFTTNIASYLGLFCGTEILFVFMMRHLILRTRKPRHES